MIEGPLNKRKTLALMLTPGSRRRMGECRGRDTPPGLPFQRQRAPAVPLLGSPQRNHGRGAWVRRRRMVRVRAITEILLFLRRKAYRQPCPSLAKLDPRPPPWTPDPPPEAASRNPAAGGPVWRGFFLRLARLCHPSRRLAGRNLFLLRAGDQFRSRDLG